MAEFTEGPWNYVGPRGDHKRIFVEDANGEQLRVEVDSDDCDYDIAVKDAHLISAAPELYAACEQLIASAGEGSLSLARAKEMARAAIKKAEGRPNG